MSLSRATRQRAAARRIRRRRGIRLISIAVVCVVAVVIAGILVLASWRSAEEHRLAVEGTEELGFSVGDPDAPVLMEEFSDYSCEFCAEFAETSHQLIETYTGDGTLRVIHMPTSFLNLPNSEVGASAAICADQQGGYWEMYDALFELHRNESPTAYTTARMVEIANTLGLDQESFEICLSSPGTASLLASINEVARARDVTGTPTIFINGERVDPQNRSFEAISQLIEPLR